MKKPPVRLKGAFGFRLGATSYIIPADILPNLEHLKDRVDDVELVLFESHEISNLPSPEDVEKIAYLRGASDLTCTVHLPLDTRLGSANEAERRASVEKCRKVAELLAPASPFAWILHLHGEHRGDPPTDDPERWIRQNRRSLEDLLPFGPPPRKICVETLDYDFDLVAGLVEDFGLSVCLDLGHLLIHGRDVDRHLNRWLDRARVFHIHGVAPGGRDHSHLGHLPDGFLEDLAARLAGDGVERVVTMEVFGEDDFERSMAVVNERLKQWRK